MKNKYEIIIHGRGGQGAKSAAEILVQAAIRKGKFVQAFPNFGPERTGAPMCAFVRISSEPIRTREPIVDPDCVLVLDETIADVVDVTRNVTGTEALIINSNKDKRELARKLKFEGNIKPIDASGISKEIVGEDRPNMVLLGKLVFVTHIVELDDLIYAFRDKYEKKLGKERSDKNIEAIEKAFKNH